VAVAKALGLEAHLLAPPSAAISRDEIYFLAPTLFGSELALHDAVRHLASRPGASILFTGHYGGVVWGLEGHANEQPEDIRRYSEDGLSLSEVRLERGFFHAAVPFLFARNAVDLRRISNSPQMAPWRVGGEYDRPIPRRILESAGVPRTLFAKTKSAMLRLDFVEPYHPELRHQYRAWLGERMGAPRLRLGAHRRIVAIDRALQTRQVRLERPPPYRGLPGPLVRLPLRGHPPRQLLTKWATEKLADDLASRLPELPADFRP
jgi:hypothetical protein